MIWVSKLELTKWIVLPELDFKRVTKNLEIKKCIEFWTDFN